MACGSAWECSSRDASAVSTIIRERSVRDASWCARLCWHFFCAPWTLRARCSRRREHDEERCRIIVSHRSEYTLARERDRLPSALQMCNPTTSSRTSRSSCLPEQNRRSTGSTNRREKRSRYSRSYPAFLSCIRFRGNALFFLERRHRRLIPKG